MRTGTVDERPADGESSAKQLMSKAFVYFHEKLMQGGRAAPSGGWSEPTARR